MKKILKKCMWKVDSAFLYVSSIALFVATILSVVNAILRSAGQGGFAWSDEACVILMIFMVFLAQPLLEGEDQNLSIGILDNIIKKPSGRKILQVIRGAVIIGILGYLLGFCFQVIEKAVRFNYRTSVLQLPRYILYACIAIAFIMIIVNWIVNIFFKKANEKYTDTLAEDEEGQP